MAEPRNRSAFRGSNVAFSQTFRVHFCAGIRALITKVTLELIDPNKLLIQQIDLSYDCATSQEAFSWIGAVRGFNF